ncbi:uncharacterized protein N7482_002616 [Penicillium canariense]|uniref:Expansin-like EG45 domain-containing protein n=1 Tax=Penicillium canariense TaxID=189055 RepID=A0A9W9IFQ9_9EURO|nr:uncharacterized protein N7482_002616 [Penicillium canariense]KAJ5176739.1 hypothetical protein N7482_002616 [Penicillium canariense]
MKYQRFACIGAVLFGAAATVSANPLVGRHENGQCPKGYTMSTYTSYSTVYLTPTPPAAPETTSTSSPIATVQTQAPAPVDSSTSVGGDVAAASTSSSTPAPATVATPAPTTETPATTTTQPAVAVVAELSTQNAAAAVETAAPTTSQEATSSASTAQAATTSTSTSSTAGGSSGKATFYGGNIAGGSCSYSGYTLPSNLFGTAFSGAVWDDAAKCGACVAVTGPAGNTIKAMVVDECPECSAGHFDLFQNAFAELSDISAGEIDITWEYTACDLDGPLQLRNKDGTSQYWFSMQVVNANEPVTKLEVSTDGGSSWQSTSRTSYNYFEQSSGFGTDTVDVRVTGESGNTVVVKSVGCASGSEITASSNL